MPNSFLQIVALRVLTPAQTPEATSRFLMCTEAFYLLVQNLVYVLFDLFPVGAGRLFLQSFCRAAVSDYFSARVYHFIYFSLFYWWYCFCNSLSLLVYNSLVDMSIKDVPRLDFISNFRLYGRSDWRVRSLCRAS